MRNLFSSPLVKYHHVNRKVSEDDESAGREPCTGFMTWRGACSQCDQRISNPSQRQGAVSTDIRIEIIKA